MLLIVVILYIPRADNMFNLIRILVIFLSISLLFHFLIFLFPIFLFLLDYNIFLYGIMGGWYDKRFLEADVMRLGFLKMGDSFALDGCGLSLDIVRTTIMVDLGLSSSSYTVHGKDLFLYVSCNDSGTCINNLVIMLIHNRHLIRRSIESTVITASHGNISRLPCVFI